MTKRKMPGLPILLVAAITLFIVLVLLIAFVQAIYGGEPACSIVCGEPVQTGPASLEMTVTALGHPMTGPFLVSEDGPVTKDHGTCHPKVDPKTECTWGGYGDPTYEGLQQVTVRFEQRNPDGDLKNSVECTLGGVIGGLPVELAEFYVE